MKQIIDTIEKLRKERRISKLDLCTAANVHSNMYASYLKGAKMSYNTVEAMLDYLGFKIQMVLK